MYYYWDASVPLWTIWAWISFAIQPPVCRKLQAVTKITLVSNRVAVAHYLITFHFCMTCVYMLYCLIEFALLMESALDGTSRGVSLHCAVTLQRPNEFMKTYACSRDI